MMRIGVNVLTLQSLKGYCAFLEKCLVSCRIKKHKTVSKSSTEVEYIAISQACSDVVWLDGLLESMKINIVKPIKLFCDSKAAAYIAQNPVFHERIKHLKIDCHYVRDKVEEEFIETPYVRSQ